MYVNRDIRIYIIFFNVIFSKGYINGTEKCTNGKFKVTDQWIIFLAFNTPFVIYKKQK